MQHAALDKGIGMIECDPDAGNIATTTTTKDVQEQFKRHISSPLPKYLDEVATSAQDQCPCEVASGCSLATH